MKNGRRRFLTPVPTATSYDELNAKLEADCRADQLRCAGRHAETIGDRLKADLTLFRPNPAGVFEPCEKRTGHVSSTSLVRYRMNDYSVPSNYGFRECVIKGFVDEVVILIGSEEIAQHTRSYERGGFVFDPLHYLALIEQKPGALDQAAPLQNWNLPKEFAHLRRVLETRMGSKGKREFIQVLRLLETFSQATVATAVGGAIRLGAPGFDAVKQLILCRIEKRPPRLDIGAYPYLPKTNVGTTRAADYAFLMPGSGA